MANTPKAVKAASEEADRLLDEMTREMEQEEQEGSPEPTAAESRQDDLSPEPDLGVPEPENTSPPLTPDPELKKAEQRYKVLQSKYDAEVPRLSRQLREIKEQTDRLLDENERLKEQMEQAARKALTKEDYLKYIPEEERELLDEAQLDTQAKVAQGVMDAVVTPKLKALQDRFERETAARAADGVERFWDLVETQVPGARETNSSDDGWFAFLDETEPVSGITYRDIGSTAIARQDSARLVKLLELYRSRDGSAERGEQRRRQVRPAEAAAAQPLSREGRSAVPRLTEAQISRFFTDVVRGKYRGREEERKKMERAIEAQLDGAR